MIIETKFDIYEKCGIVELDNHQCLIIGIKIEGKNLFYEIQYWWESKLTTLYLMENELSKWK